MCWPNLRTVDAMRSQRSLIKVEVTRANAAVQSALWDSNRLRLHSSWTHFDRTSALLWNVPGRIDVTHEGRGRETARQATQGCHRRHVYTLTHAGLCKVHAQAVMMDFKLAQFIQVNLLLVGLMWVTRVRNFW